MKRAVCDSFFGSIKGENQKLKTVIASWLHALGCKYLLLHLPNSKGWCRSNSVFTRERLILDLR